MSTFQLPFLLNISFRREYDIFTQFYIAIVTLQLSLTVYLRRDGLDFNLSSHIKIISVVYFKRMARSWYCVGWNANHNFWAFWVNVFGPCSIHRAIPLSLSLSSGKSLSLSHQAIPLPLSHQAIPLSLSHQAISLSLSSGNPSLSHKTIPLSHQAITLSLSVAVFQCYCVILY